MKIPPNLGRYEVVDLIGQGGMGALYRARDPRIGRYVAIKLLRPGYDTPELRDRFSREARAAGCLSHQNIVTIYDVGEHDGLPFIAMEYVRGETFTDLLGLRPPLPVLRKVQLTEEVCAGLNHAHEAGIVHRDIKPANLIVGPEGTVKILDFGIAKLTATGITVPGAIIGTLNYMSPEQVKGDPVDARADIFAVGAVLYELLTHQPAFPGELPDEVFRQILKGVPTPMTDYVPDPDPRLVSLVEQALEKDPDDRFESIAAVQRELANIRLNPQGSFIPAPPPPVRQTPSPASPDPARIRAQQIEGHLIAARHAFDAGDYQAAIESCKQVLMLDTSDQRALAQLDRIHEAVDAQQEAVRTAIERGRAAYESGNLLTALREFRQALALEPQNEEAPPLVEAVETLIRQKQEESRIRTAVDEARRRFEKGDHQPALRSLEALPASNPIVAETLEELRIALRDIEEQQRIEKERLEEQRRIEAARLEEQRRLEAARVEQQRRIAALLGAARTALKGHHLDEAAQALERVRELDPGATGLTDFAERLSRAEAAKRLKEDLERRLADFDAQLAHDDLAHAGALLEAAAALAPADPLVRAARKRLDEANAVAAARALAEARRREAEEKIDAAALCLDSGDLAGAADLLDLAADLAPMHPRAAELSHRLHEALERQAAAEAAERLRRQVEELLQRANERLHAAGDDASELSPALRDVKQALELDPQNADAPALKAAIEDAIATRREAARVRTAIENARRRFANGKHQAAIKLLEDFPPPAHPGIADALAQLRADLAEIEEQRRLERERLERQQRVAALLADARTKLREQQFDAALELATKVEEVDPTTADLAPLRDQIREEQAAARTRAELDRVLAEVNERLGQGELAEAGELLSAAAALSTTDPRIAAARRRLEQAVAAREAAEARAREVEEKHASAEALFAQGDLQGAMRLLALGSRLDPTHTPTAELTARVGEAIKAQEAAEAAARLRQTIDGLLAGAEKHLHAPQRQMPDVMSAMQNITQALALAPDDERAKALKVNADEAIAALREAARIDAAIRNARNRFANGKHQAALQLLEGLDASAHPAVAETLRELRGLYHGIQELRRAEQEAAERKVKTAALVANARVALETRRYSDALETLSAARSINPFADGVAELTERALNEQAAQNESMKAAGAERQTRDRTRTPPIRERAIEHRTSSDEEATVFLAPAVDSREELDSKRPSTRTATPIEHDTSEDTQVSLEAAQPFEESEAGKRPWPLLVGAAFMLLATLVALWILFSW